MFPDSRTGEAINIVHSRLHGSRDHEQRLKYSRSILRLRTPDRDLGVYWVFGRWHLGFVAWSHPQPQNTRHMDVRLDD
jgi:hypothetical protein